MKRYDIDIVKNSRLRDSENGEWVRWEDVEELQNKLDGLYLAYHDYDKLANYMQENHVLPMNLGRKYGDVAVELIIELKEEVERLKLK